MKVVVDRIGQEAPHILTFYFRPETPIAYTAGQYIRLTVRHLKPDDRGIKRWFTLSSSPSDELLSITTKFVDHNGSTFTEALRRAAAGDEFEMEEPRGTFVLPENPETPLIFVAGGIGITPFHSMFRWLEAIGERRTIKLLYAVSKEEDIIFRPMLDNLGTSATITVQYPSPQWQGDNGLLKPERISEAARQWPTGLIYISGPEIMVESLRTGLIKLNVPEERLVLDAFLGYASV